MLKRLRQILNEPYPELVENQVDVLGLIALGSFVAGFLIVFQPFGLAYSNFPHKNLILAGFGLITVVCVLIVDYLLAPILQRLMGDNEFRFKHWILWTLIIVFLIASANFIYRGLLWKFSFKLYLVAITNTLAIAIFPIIAFGLLNRIKHLKRYTLSAEKAKTELKHEETENGKVLKLIDEKGQTAFEAKQEDLLYLKNSDNYVSVFYRHNDQVKEELIRSSMKSLTEQLDSTPLTRCHRGFIVNLNRIEDISGNAQGWRLKLKGMDGEIPVSRSYIPRIQRLLSA